MASTIGFLATGDEICDGDVVNTNTPALARLLREHGWQIGYTLCVPDNEECIIDGVTYLVNNKHDVIITTGGLGPTEDDRTRFALARFVNQPLEFNDASWQRLSNRFKQYFKITIPENNRQQALFPKHAHVLANDRGSADSCWLEHDNTLIFMLPGPPHECSGVMDEHVLSLLGSHPSLTHSTTPLLKWYLLGASEGHIATEMEALLQQYDCRTGYRADYPYLEFKVWVTDITQQQAIQHAVDNALQAYCLMPVPQIASRYCHDIISQQQQVITIDDQATAGMLQSCLTTHKTYPLLQFTHTAPNHSDCYLRITGLSEFWHAEFNSGIPTALETNLQLQFKRNNQQQQAEKIIPIRNRRVATYAAEWVSYQLAKWLEK